MEECEISRERRQGRIQRDDEGKTDRDQRMEIESADLLDRPIHAKTNDAEDIAAINGKVRRLK